MSQREHEEQEQSINEKGEKDSVLELSPGTLTTKCFLLH